MHQVLNGKIFPSPLKISLKIFFLLGWMFIFQLSQGKEVQDQEKQNPPTYSIQDKNSNPTTYDDSFYTAGLATMTLFFFSALLLLTLLGTLLASIGLFLILGLGLTGIISASLIYGLYKKSLEKAFKTFLILGFGFTGMLSCALLFPLINKILHWTAGYNALLIGIGTGLLSGFITGWIFFHVLKTFTKRFVSRNSPM